MGFHLNFDVNIWSAILTFGSICCCVLICALSFTIWQFYFNTNTDCPTAKKTKNIHFRIKIYSLCSLSFFLLAQILNHLYIILIKLPSGTLNRFNENLWGMYNSCWSFGYFFTYLLFFERLRQTFKQSLYQLTQKEIFLFISLIILFIISQQLISIIWLIFVLDTIDWKTFNDIYGVALIIKFIIDFVLNVYIVYLFCSKIFKITLEKTSYYANSPSPTSPTSSPIKSPSSLKKRDTKDFKNEHSSKIFEIMIKYFLLTFLTVLSTQMFTASQITLSTAINHAVHTSKFQFYYDTYMVHFVLGCTDSMVSTMYIMLTFPFANEWYKKLCNWSHRICIDIWSKCASLNQDNNNNQELMKMQHKQQSIEVNGDHEVEMPSFNKYHNDVHNGVTTTDLKDPNENQEPTMDTAGSMDGMDRNQSTPL